MFPTGLIEVMVTPLVPPRLAPPLAPDLVLGLALCEVLRFLGLPTRTPFSLPVALDLSCLIAATRVPDPRTARSQPAPLGPRRREALYGPECHRPTGPAAGENDPLRQARSRILESAGCGSVFVTCGRSRAQDLEPRSRPDNESVTPPSSPFVLDFCLFRSLSACLASSFARLVFSFCALPASAVSLPLLRPAFLLLGLVAGHGAPGLFGLAFGLVVHDCSLSFDGSPGPAATGSKRR